MSDVEDLLHLLLTAAAPGVRVSTEQPAQLPEGMPCTVARRVGGAAIAPGLLDRATCDVQVWAASKRQASELSATYRDALHTAWQQQTVTAAGHLAFLLELAAPVELATDDQPAGTWRYQASYSLGARPPSTP